MNTRLDTYNNSWYKSGGSSLKRVLWFFINILFVQCNWNPFSSFRVFLLRMFGAQIGKGVRIKPGVHIKYPWRLTIGNYVWLGEEVWIDNLADIVIEDHVCISQGAYLLTGNHDFTKVSFDLIVKPIHLEAGVWIGAKGIVCPGVVCGTHSVLTAGSVARKALESYKIYSGNPATIQKTRVIK